MLFVRELVSLLEIFVYKVLRFVNIYGHLPRINVHWVIKLPLDGRMIEVSPSFYSFISID